MDELKETKNNPETQESNKEQKSEKLSFTKEELQAIKNFAAAQARKATEKVYENDFIAKSQYEEVVKQNEELLFEKNKTARFEEYSKFGGRKDAYDTFCKLHKDIICEQDETKRKVLFEKAYKEDPILFNKAFVASTSAIINNVKQENNKESPYYFDENGVARRRE